MKLRLGSRGSALARWQAAHLTGLLQREHPGLEVELVILQTTGDRITDVPLARIGDRGLFTKEIDRAVVGGVVDLAIHSFKDVPTRLADGQEVGAVLEREDPSDALVVAPGRPPSLEGLPAGAVVGTSSLRRRAQLLARRPDLRVEDLRGNLDTRLERVLRGDFDAALLARAGIRRLGREAAISEVLESPDWLPAVGQGALAVAMRGDDERVRRLLAPLDHPVTRSATAAERALLRALEGGCQIPIGAHASCVHDRLRLHAFVASLDGSRMLRGHADGAVRDADAIGRGLADDLLAQGAGEILDEVRARGESELPRASAP